MRQLVIDALRSTKWFQNMLDEYEGMPPSLDALIDSELLDLYLRHV